MHSPLKHSWLFPHVISQKFPFIAWQRRYFQLLSWFFFPKYSMHRPEILGHFLELALWAPYASCTHLNIPSTALRWPSVPDTQVQVHQQSSLQGPQARWQGAREGGSQLNVFAQGKAAQRIQNVGRGHAALDWAPAGWKPRINNSSNNKKISKACQLGRDIWLVIRGACESINPSPSWISTLKHASLHCCRGTCWMSCKDEWN